MYPELYNPEETEPIGDYKCFGKLWEHLKSNSDLPSHGELLQLAGGQNPWTGEKLTARRHANSEKQHRVAYIDLVIGVPKSVSLLSEIGGDKRIRKAVSDTNKEVLELIEREYAGTRPRRGSDPDRNGFRKTGKIAAITFLENESRDGDPLLHPHNRIFNVTWDELDPKHPFKALGITRLMDDQKFLADFAMKVLQAKIRALGYMTVPTMGGRSFEIVGIGRPLIEKFSKRHMAIKAGVASHKRKNPKPSVDQDEVKLEQKIAKKIRPKKKIWTQAKLRAQWDSELTPVEKHVLMTIAANAQGLQAPNLGPRTPVAPPKPAPAPRPPLVPQPVSPPAPFRKQDPVWTPAPRTPAPAPEVRPLAHPPRPAPVTFPERPAPRWPEAPPPPRPQVPDEEQGMPM